jgi:hypothetical protein
MTKEYKQERAAFEAWMADNEVRMHHAHLNHEEEMREAYFAGMKQARAAMAAAPVQAMPGWKLVPVEPTLEMLKAAASEWLKHGEEGARFPLAQGFESPGLCPSQRIEYSRATHVYRAAAPAAPQVRVVAFEALETDLIAECERAMRQRDEFLRTGVRTGGDGMAWNTCFGFILRKHGITPNEK